MVRGYKIKTFNITKKELPARQWKAKAFNNFHPSGIFYVYTKEALDELMSSLLEDCAGWGYNIFDRVKNEYIMPVISIRLKKWRDKIEIYTTKRIRRRFINRR